MIGARAIWQFWHAVHRYAQLTVWVNDPTAFPRFVAWFMSRVEQQ